MDVAVDVPRDVEVRGVADVTQVVQATFAGLMLWTLPTTTADFSAWLDEQTNAVKIGDDVLAWPWQVRTP